MPTRVSLVDVRRCPRGSMLVHLLMWLLGVVMVVLSLGMNLKLLVMMLQHHARVVHRACSTQIPHQGTSWSKSCTIMPGCMTGAEARSLSL